MDKHASDRHEAAPSARSSLARVAGAAALFLLLSASAVQGAQNDAFVIVEPTSPATISFDGEGAASLTLVVLNNSDAPAMPIGSVLSAKSGQSIASSDLEANGYVAQVESSQIGPRSAGALTLRVQRSTTATDKFDAFLVVSASGLESATLRVTEVAAKGLADGRLQPTSVNILATRSVPTFLGAKDQWIYTTLENAPRGTVTLNSVAASAVPGNPTAVLPSDRGGRLTVLLVPHGASETTSEWEVRLGSGDGAGKYSGKLSLDSTNDKAPTIDVTVNVQDFILWPAIALSVGTWLAYQFSKLRDIRRPRALLRYHLARVGEGYADARARSCTSERDRKWLARTFHVDPKSGKVGFDATRDTVADHLYGSISTAADAGVLSKLEQSTRDLEELVGTWTKVCEAATTLDGKIRGDLVGTSTAFATARALLNRTNSFTTPAEATEFLKALNDQGAALEIVVKARGLYDLAKALWCRLTPSERGLNAKLSPDDVWSTRVRHLSTKDELVSEGVLGMLAALNQDLTAVVKAKGSELEGFAFDDGELTEIVEAAGQFDTAAELLAVEAMFPPVERRPAAALLDVVRTMDKWDFVISGAITSVVFLQGLYVDKNFGTEWHYLAAIMAALAGTLVISWKLLPWYRDYRLPKAS
jgi:hypothetical protein